MKPRNPKIRIWLCGPVGRVRYAKVPGNVFALILSETKPRVGGNWWTGHYAGTYLTRFGDPFAPRVGECIELRPVVNTPKRDTKSPKPGKTGERRGRMAAKRSRR